MKKRIISLIAAVAVLITAIQTAVTDMGVIAAADDYAPYTQSKAFLEGIGIIDGKDDINMNVTRGKAAALICSMLDANQNLLGYRGIFVDVAEDNEDALSIEKLADLGIVRGGDDYTYRPFDMLTYTEAGYIFANTLGYGLISGSGITPVQVITEFGINDGVKADFDYVTLGDFYVMMKNALFSGSYVQSTYGSKNEYTKSDKTLLYSIYEIVYDDGRIVRNDVTSLWSAEDYGNAGMLLELGSGDTVEIKTANPAAVRDDLGKKVRVYYKKNKATGDFDYIYHEVKSVNKTLTIRLDAIDASGTAIENGTVAYYSDSDRLLRVNLSSDVCVIYNGVAYKSSSFDFKAAADKVGTVELIDYDGDSRYETVKITAYDSVVAGVVSTSNNFISDKYETNRIIDIDEDKYTKIFVYDADGNETDFSAITNGSVVSAAKSDTYGTENVLTLRVSMNVINGKITNVKKVGSVQYITIDDGDTYGAYDRAAAESFGRNENIVAYIDAFGNIVYTTTDYNRDMQYGVLAGVGKPTSALDPTIKVKIVSSAGKVGEYELDKKIQIDGKSYSGQENEAYARLNGISFKTSDITFPKGVSPIRYKLSADGLTVKKLDTILSDKEGTDDALELLGSGTYYCNSGQVLGWSIPFAADAVVLEFLSPDYSEPSAFREELDIDVNNASVFRQGTSYHVAALKSDKESSAADFLLKFNFTEIKIGYDNDLFVVDEVSEGINETQDSIMYLVSGYLKGSYTQFWVDKSHSQTDIITSLKRGDIIRYDTSKDGRLINCEKLLTLDGEGKMTTYTADGNNFRRDWGSTLTLICGYAYSVDGSLIRTNRFDAGTYDMDVSKLDWNSLIAGGSLGYIGATSSIPVTVVDMGRDKIEAGSTEDIYDYLNFKNESSLVFAKYRSGNLSEIVVYNK